MPYYQYVFLVVIVIILIIVLWRTANKTKTTKKTKTQRETFVDVAAAAGSEEKIEYMRLVSKLSDKAIQPYKGTMDTSLTVNAKKNSQYYPQLWILEKNTFFKNVANGRYLTVSADQTKVVLEPKRSADDPSQTWTLDTATGFITSGRKGLALHLAGSNNKEDALVVVTQQGEGAAFQWYIEKVYVDIQRKVLLAGTLNGKTQHVVNTVQLGRDHVCTYSLWINVASMAHRKGQLKNVFVRGRGSPGVWLAPTDNRVHILWQNQETVVPKDFGFDLDTWFHLALVVDNLNLTVYIDGQVGARHTYRSELLVAAGNNNNNNITFCMDGGFDGMVANAEYVNKAQSITEVNQRLAATNPTPPCKEGLLPATVVRGNVLPQKDLDTWSLTPGLTHIKKNQTCPPPTLGGTTVSFKIKDGNSSSSSSMSTSVNLLDNQYYTVSLWVLGADVNVRPFYTVGKVALWTGEWKTVANTKWMECKWDFFNNSAGAPALTGGEAGFEFNTKNYKATHTVFLPVVTLKVLATVTDTNVPVLEYRSNGTHSTCSSAITTKDIGLNATGGWCALKDTRDEYYLEAHFDNLYHLNKVHTRGRGDYPQWTTEFRLEYYDVYYNTWRRYGGTFEGNTDMHTVKVTSVDVLTQKIRVYPVSFQGWPALRVAFSGSVGLKSKCTDYKVKAAHHLNVEERARNLALFNKECRTVNYAEYEQTLQKQKEQAQIAATKAQKLEIDAATWHQKYTQTKQDLDNLQLQTKKKH